MQIPDAHHLHAKAITKSTVNPVRLTRNMEERCLFVLYPHLKLCAAKSTVNFAGGYFEPRKIIMLVIAVIIKIFVTKTNASKQI